MPSRLPCLLLIDDDDVTTFLNKNLIKRLSICDNVDVARNGREGMEKLNNLKCPTLIFLDLNMPVMDGFEFLVLFNNLSLEKKENINIVVLTSSLNPLDLERLTELGVKHVLNKPLKPDQLLTLITQLYSAS